MNKYKKAPKEKIKEFIPRSRGFLPPFKECPEGFPFGDYNAHDKCQGCPAADDCQEAEADLSRIDEKHITQ